MVYILLAYLTIVPLVYFNNVDPRQYQELWFQTMSCLVILAGMFFDNKPVRSNKFIMGVGVAGLSFLLTWYRLEMGWSIFLNAFLGIGVFFTIIRTVSIKDINKILIAMVYMGCFAVIYLAFQRAGWDMRAIKTLNAPGVTPDCSFLGIKAAYGMFMACLSPIFVYFIVKMFTYDDIEGTLRKKCNILAINTIKLIATIFLLMGVMFTVSLSYSTGAMVGAGISIIMFLWFIRRRLFWAILIPCIFAVAFYICMVDNPMGMQKTRLDMWGKVIQDAWEEPFGHGLDSFRNPGKKIPGGVELVRYFKFSFNDETARAKKTFVVKDYDVNEWEIEDNKYKEKMYEEKSKGNSKTIDFWDHPHNETVWLFYELGFLGLGVFGFLLHCFIDRFRRSKRNAEIVALTMSIMAFWLCSITQFPLHLARVGYLLPLIVGLWYITTENNEDKAVSGIK